MQGQHNLANFYSQAFVTLRVRLMLLVIIGSVLLLAALAITFQMYFTESAHHTLSAAQQLVEGPPDIIIL